MKKENFIPKTASSLAYNQVRTMYHNKYYNLFMNSLEWDGLEPDEKNYIMRQFWDKGTVCAFKLKNLEDVAFAEYSVQSWNRYDFPEQVLLINKRQAPGVPMNPQVRNKDVVIGFIQQNHKPIESVINYYIDRLASIDMVIHTNLMTHQLPFIVAGDAINSKKLNALMDKITNFDLSITMTADDLESLKTFATSTPYIIDKLYDYKTALEGELLTFLGIDNAGVEKKERLIVDETNANNQLINAFGSSILSCLEDFTKEIKEVLGRTITVKPIAEPVNSVHEEAEPAEKEEVVADE